jgi:superfamily II RNA helicase
MKKCEELAQMLYSLDLNSATEKGTVHILTAQASARLSKSDSRLPQVQTVCEMVKRGIGVVSNYEGGLIFA